MQRLGEPTALVAFILTVNLSPRSTPRSIAAKRIGIKSPDTARNLVRAAVNHGAIATAIAPDGTVLVARPGYVFDPVKNVPIKKTPVKNEPAHKTMEDSTNNERILLSDTTLLQERGGLEENFESENGLQVGDWRSLSDWRSGNFFKGRCFSAEGQPEEFMDILDWRNRLKYYGGAPAHIAKSGAHRQALEIAHELEAVTNEPGWHIMVAIAFRICQAHAQGKPIRSFGFIAERKHSISQLSALPLSAVGSRFPRKHSCPRRQ